MNPKDKAIELVNKYLQVYDGKVKEAKQCALIAVDEIIDAINWHSFEYPNDEVIFWNEVINELNKQQ